MTARYLTFLLFLFPLLQQAPPSAPPPPRFEEAICQPFSPSPSGSGLIFDPDDFVLIEGDTFEMGCTGEQKNCGDEEKPVHRVTLSDFYIDKYEVTQKQWRMVMGSHPRNLYNTGCEDCPVEGVSWDAVQKFLKKLNRSLPAGQKPYRLPTEAEWEFAARGGTQSKNYQFAGSNALEDVGWYISNSYPGNTNGAQKTTRPVGQKKANELGLYDMSGNVFEWCMDWFDSDYYASSPQTNPTGPTSGYDRVLRGGSWYSNPRLCRVALRTCCPPDGHGNGFGFRLARSL